MSKTFNTKPLQYRTLTKDIKVVFEDPGKNNYHPVNSDFINFILELINAKYIIGLKNIHFKPRKTNTEIGLLGQYYPYRQSITLFSFPIVPYMSTKSLETVKDFKTSIMEFKAVISDLGMHIKCFSSQAKDMRCFGL